MSEQATEKGVLTEDGKRILRMESDEVLLCEFSRDEQFPNMTDWVRVKGKRVPVIPVAIDYPGCVFPAIIPDTPVLTEPSDVADTTEKTNVVSLHNPERKKGQRQKPLSAKDKKLAKATARAQRELQKDFNRWKDQLCTMIRNDSKVEYSEGGTVQYLLPRELVEVVWTTSIYEFIKIAQMKRDKAKEEGIESIESLGVEATRMMKERIQTLADKITGETNEEEGD